jgi:hypothetical protein
MKIAAFHLIVFEIDLNHGLFFYFLLTLSSCECRVDQMRMSPGFSAPTKADRNEGASHGGPDADETEAYPDSDSNVGGLHFFCKNLIVSHILRKLSKFFKNNLEK